MKTFLPSLGLLLLPLTAWADPSLTIYNQNFAVVRDTVALDLKAGTNSVSFPDTTAQLEPSSVILRDPSGKVALQILEQGYRNDPISQALLLSLNEGKVIDFAVREANKPDRVVQGKVIRSGYAPGGGQMSEPVIEVEGKIQFGLPGQPIFPSLGSDTILKPRLDWLLEAEKPAKLEAELAYITGGLLWEADYNVVSPEDSDLIDIIGWVTMNNQSGKTFDNARIKLMAGDVSKLQPQEMMDGLAKNRMAFAASAPKPMVTEKSFDEYHLYTLQRPTTLRDRETKQVEFIRASGVKSARIYVYDGLQLDWNRYGGRANLRNFRNNEELGAENDTKVAVMREFKNTKENQLGMPLPAGRLRFYRQDGASMEFTGENTIDHTPKDETVRVFTGNAFDLVGERKRMNFQVDSSNKWVNESFEITLTNHKKEAVEIRVVEHLFRWFNWEITENSAPFVKTNAQEIEFRVQLKPDEKKTLTYQVHYSW